MSDHTDFKFMLPGSVGPVLVLRRFNNAFIRYCAFYEHEQHHACDYDGLTKTPEDAIDRFIKYRIQGKKQSDEERGRIRSWHDDE